MNQEENTIQEPLIQLTLGSQPNPITNRKTVYEFSKISTLHSKNDIIEAAKKNQMAILNAAVESIPCIHKLIDHESRTVLHYLALNGNCYVFMRLLQKYGGEATEWLSVADVYGFQAVHYVIYKQKMELLEEIKKYYTPINLLGIAAYNNDIELMIHIYELNGNQYLDEKIKGNITPLHMACANKSDYASILLMRWKCQINSADDDGNTPLHISAKQNNAKIIRKIIQRGGSVNIRNKENLLPLDLTKDEATIDALKSFRFTWKQFLLQLNIKPRKRSMLQALIFLAFFLLVDIGTLLTSVILSDSQQVLWIRIFYIVISFITFASYMVVMLKEPGFVQIENIKNLPELLQKIERFEICFDCYVKIQRRSKHCEFCKRCVDKYDHHCPWINNCVFLYCYQIGKDNLYHFLSFIILLFLNFLFSIAVGLWSLSGVDELLTQYQYSRTSFKQSVLIALVVIELLFLIPLFNLILTQITNIRAGQTTYERLILQKPRNPKRTSIIQKMTETENR